MKAAIKYIDYCLPETILSNDELSANFSNWTPEKLKCKTGIVERHIAESDTCASDLAYEAAKNLFKNNPCSPADIDFVLFCTQSPDYFLPTSACILQHRLNLPTSCGALDFNLGCSGYVYGLGIAKGLIESRQARNVLLLTADTYTKYLSKNDISTRSIFGDAGTATLISIAETEDYRIGSAVWGTDGAGADNLIVKSGAARNPFGSEDDNPYLHMNGPEIFLFTLKKVPLLIHQILQREKKQLSDIDLFVFHQANKYMLEHLREKIQIPADKFYISMEDIGNTVSSTIPIALKRAYDDKTLMPGKTTMLVSFGVGYSWGGMCVRPFDEE